MVKIPSLEEAFARAQDPRASERELLIAADTLVSWGHVNLADQVLNRLRSNQALAGQVNKLAAVSRQLRRSGALTELAAMHAAGTVPIDGEHEAFMARHLGGSNKLIVVFTGIGSRFWLSLMLLHMFLKRLNTHIIYLSDLRQFFFLDGLEIAKGYHGLLQALRGAVVELGAEEVYVLANSAGGFAGLRYAIDLRARSFLGLSIATDLSGSLPVGEFLTRDSVRQAAPHMFVDLRPLVATSYWPERILLYCGEKNPVDPLHAQHLSDLPNVEVTMLENYGPHDIVSGLLARGTFEQVLRDFVGAVPGGKVAAEA